MNRETLSLLGPKTTRYDTVGAGGIPTLTWEMVSQVLAKLPDHISAYARMKYNGEFTGEGYGSNFHVALDALRSMAGCLEMQETMKASYFLNMTKVVLLESISEGHICPACNGTKQVLRGANYHTCTLCKGSGRLKFKNETVSKMIGYGSERSFQRYGRKKYDKLLREISGNWEMAIESACKDL